MAQAAANKDVLSNTDNLRILSNVLKTNVAACTSIGSFFLPQIGLIYMDMLGLYRAVSGIISETVAKDGLSRGSIPRFTANLPCNRTNCYQNTENSSTEDSQERNSQASRDLYSQGRGFGGCQQQYDSTTIRCNSWGLSSQRP